MYSQRQINILQSLYPNIIMEKALVETSFNLSKSDSTLTMLSKDSMLRIYFDTSSKADTVFLTEQGRAYVQDFNSRKKEKLALRWHDWINTGIAVLALIVAAVSLFR